MQSRESTTMSVLSSARGGFHGRKQFRSHPMGTSSATVASLLLLAAPAAAFSITPSAAAFSITPSASASRRQHTMTSIRMEEIDEATTTTTTAPRSMDAAEEKAIRKARIGFGGYPPGAYYELVQTDKPAVMHAVARTLDLRIALFPFTNPMFEPLCGQDPSGMIGSRILPTVCDWPARPTTSPSRPRST